MTTFLAGTRAAAPTPSPGVAAVDVPYRSPADRHGVWWVAASAIVWGTSLIVAALWVRGGGVEDLIASPASALQSVGRLAGLVASDLLLAQVLLMARVPVFERGFGHDGITRLHRRVGFWSFWLMLGHIAIITIGYALPDTDVIGEFVTLVLTYPAMLLALAGTLAILAVAFTSMRAARRRLRYESWHLLHLYGYLGVGLALPHQLWTGADFLSSPVATAYWWSLWGVTAAAVIVFRVLVPLGRALRWDLRVRSVERTGPDAVTMTVAPHSARRPQVTPGQFLVWRVPGGPGRLRGTPLSTAVEPDGALRVTMKVIGSETARLAALRPGTRVWAEGPYGTLTGARRTGRRMVAFGAGSGVVPLVAILESDRYAPGEAVLVTRDHAVGGGVMPARVQRLVDERGVRAFTLDGPRATTGAAWLPEAYADVSARDMLRHLAGDIADADVFVVGPPAWTAALRGDLRAAGVSAKHIHTENFAI